MPMLTEPPQTARFPDWPPEKVEAFTTLIRWLANRPPSEVFAVIHEITKIHRP